MFNCVGKLRIGLMLDDVKDLINREIQDGEGDGTFGLRRRWESVLLGSWGLVPSCMFPRAIRLKILRIIM